MLAIFTITIFLGAAMLFLVQPMIAKMILPLLGGSPSVWNTCVVFFQVLLLAGYAYAHWSTKWLGLRRQIAVHVVIVSIPLVLWIVGIPPIELPAKSPPSDQAPVLWLLAALVFSIGPAFFMLSTCGPLIQRWFSGTDHRAAQDPYFLYAASNAGSMLALLAYPLVIEPTLTLGQQRRIWSIAYAVFGAATVVCALLTRGRFVPVERAAPAVAEPVAWSRRLRWVILAMVPSSLMLAVTQYLSTDIAAIPLLWVVPLAVYLLTFILAFSRRTIVPLRTADRTLPILVVALAVIVLLARHDPIWIIMVLNIAALFFGAMLCHLQLAASRPGPARLTEFYLLIAVGGVLGGLFNAILAPVFFKSLLEYPIILAAACLLRPTVARPGSRPVRFVTDIGLAMIPVVIALLPGLLLPVARDAGFISGAVPETVKMFLGVGIPLIACYLFVSTPVRFGLAVGALILVQALIRGRYVDERRTFFGLYTVQNARTPQDREIKEFLHGTTMHGAQWTDPAVRSEPLIYYHRLGPVGDIFRAYGGMPLFDRVALVGLGTGTLAAYGRPGQQLTFFELDREVVSMSGDGGAFHYVGDSKARCDFNIGDARLRLSFEPDGLYGLILLDAFSSDAVPVHLLTREAVRMYITKLKTGGILAFHASNRYLELERVISGVTRDLGLVAAIRNDEVADEESDRILHWSSTWIAVARSNGDLAPLLVVNGWGALEPRSTDRVWTDDHSSFAGIFEWSGSR